jgi:hypothetical protein
MCVALQFFWNEVGYGAVGQFYKHLIVIIYSHKRVILHNILCSPVDVNRLSFFLEWCMLRRSGTILLPFYGRKLQSQHSKLAQYSVFSCWCE